MDISEIFKALFSIDVRTLIAVLIWGNFISVLMIFVYKATHSVSTDSWLSRYYMVAKLAQAVGYIGLFLRGALPDLISVNASNTLLLAGFYFEAIAMLTIIHEQHKKIYFIEFLIAAMAIIAFNVAEFIKPDPSLRIVMASIGIFSVFIVPDCMLLFSKRTTTFKRLVGVFYAILLLLLMPRVIYAIINEVGILSNAWIQVLTFLAFVWLMFFSGSGYLLLMKENADRVITMMASIDAMTGLANRHSFLAAAGEAFNVHKRHKESLSILFCDIDDFKKINDGYGHLFGDHVLLALTSALKQSLRVCDLSCRYGGEEFVILLSGADVANTQKICQRIMTRISELEFEGKPDFFFTISIGVMNSVPAEGDTLMQYIDKADKGLYIAKNSGKNKAVFYQNQN